MCLSCVDGLWGERATSFYIVAQRRLRGKVQRRSRSKRSMCAQAINIQGDGRMLSFFAKSVFRIFR